VYLRILLKDSDISFIVNTIQFIFYIDYTRSGLNLCLFCRRIMFTHNIEVDDLFESTLNLGF